jgi:uncharacterized protein YlzI (FlbEa/FlbD family)
VIGTLNGHDIESLQSGPGVTLSVIFGGVYIQS